MSCQTSLREARSVNRLSGVPILLSPQKCSHEGVVLEIYDSDQIRATFPKILDSDYSKSFHMIQQVFNRQLLRGLSPKEQTYRQTAMLVRFCQLFDQAFGIETLGQSRLTSLVFSKPEDPNTKLLAIRIHFLSKMPRFDEASFSMLSPFLPASRKEEYRSVLLGLANKIGRNEVESWVSHSSIFSGKTELDPLLVFVRPKQGEKVREVLMLISAHASSFPKLNPVVVHRDHPVIA